MAWLSFVVVVFLPLCHLEGADAVIPGVGWVTGLLVDNAKNAGIPLPGYMALLSKKSNFLTNLLHYLFGNKLEERFKMILKRDMQYLPESASIEDVNEDNEEKMTFKDGTLTGLKSIELTANTDVEIIWDSIANPVAIVSVNFKALKINANIKKTFTIMKVKKMNVDGPAEMKVLQNNFVLKFHLYPGIFEWCYLKLYDVICSDLEELVWDVKDAKGTNDNFGNFAMQDYFSQNEGTVEEHIKTSIANIIYHEIPRASPAICDNTNKLRHSKYQTFKKKHEFKKDSEASADKSNVQPQQVNPARKQ